MNRRLRCSYSLELQGSNSLANSAGSSRAGSAHSPALPSAEQRCNRHRFSRPVSFSLGDSLRKCADNLSLHVSCHQIRLESYSRDWLEFGQFFLSGVKLWTELFE